MLNGYEKEAGVISSPEINSCPKIVDGEECIIKLRVDYEKVKNLHVFNSQPLINDLIVSRKVYSEIKKRKLNFGISFGIVYCVNKDK